MDRLPLALESGRPSISPEIESPPASGDGPPIMAIPLGGRRFLLRIGGAAAYAALRPHESWARKMGRALPPLQAWTLPAEPPSHPVDLARAVIGAGVLAPSNWNSQPWRMEV